MSLWLSNARGNDLYTRKNEYKAYENSAWNRMNESTHRKIAECFIWTATLEESAHNMAFDDRV